MDKKEEDLIIILLQMDGKDLELKFLINMTMEIMIGLIVMEMKMNGLLPIMEQV